MQTVRSTIGHSTNSTLETNVEVKNGHAHSTLDAHAPIGEFLKGHHVHANVVAPSDESQSVMLTQIALGRYETDFNLTQRSVYLLRFSRTSQDGFDSFAETIGWTLSYSPEYKHLDSIPDLLLRLAAVSGGKLAPSNSAEAITHALKATRLTPDLAMVNPVGCGVAAF